jgi:hypothetical protein
MSTRKYICNCSVHCIVPTEVGRSTYYKHAPYRNELNISFGDFAGLSEQQSAPIDNDRDNSLDHNQEGDQGILGDRIDTGGPRKRQRIDDSDDEESEVCNYTMHTHLN